MPTIGDLTAFASCAGADAASAGAEAAGAAAATGAAIWSFVPLGFHAPGFILFHGVMASMMLAQLGMIGGIWSEKFDHIAAFTNFVVTPLTFLSGTFYSVDRLPSAFWWLAHFNPFFYMIDGFRRGFFGASDVSPWLSLAVVGVSFAVVALLALRLLANGYKLRA